MLSAEIDWTTYILFPFCLLKGNIHSSYIYTEDSLSLRYSHNDKANITTVICNCPCATSLATYRFGDREQLPSSRVHTERYSARIAAKFCRNRSRMLSSTMDPLAAPHRAAHSFWQCVTACPTWSTLQSPSKTSRGWFVEANQTISSHPDGAPKRSRSWQIQGVPSSVPCSLTMFSSFSVKFPLFVFQVNCELHSLREFVRVQSSPCNHSGKRQR